MIRWLFSRGTPLSTGQRVDLELLTRRTLEILSLDWLKARELCTVPFELPTGQHGLDQLAEQIASQLGVAGHLETQALTCEVVPSDQLLLMLDYQPACGDGGAVLKLPEHVVSDPLRCTVTMAVGISTHVWQLCGLQKSDLDIRMASLLPITGGMGPLVADAALYDTHWKSGGFAGWSLSRMGQYNAMEVGYTMALCARLTGDGGSAWLDSLRLDARATAQQATRYFTRCRAAQQPLLVDAHSIPSNSRRPAELSQWIREGPRDFALSSARVLHHRFRSEQSRVEPRELVDAVVHASDSKDIHLQVAFTELIGACHLDQDVATSRLVKLSQHKQPEVAMAALKSATALGIPLAVFAPAAKRLLHRKSFDLLPVLDWIARAGGDCESLAPCVCELLRDALMDEDEAGVAATAAALHRVAPDAIAICQRLIKDEAVFGQAKQHLEAMQEGMEPTEAG